VGVSSSAVTMDAFVRFDCLDLILFRSFLSSFTVNEDEAVITDEDDDDDDDEEDKTVDVSCCNEGNNC
jgi:hypothetical protein